MYREKLDLKVIKVEWLNALDRARVFLTERDPVNVGCLYYSTSQQKFISPEMPDVELKVRMMYLFILASWAEFCLMCPFY